MNDPEQLLDIQQAARFLHVSETSPAAVDQLGAACLPPPRRQARAAVPPGRPGGVHGASAGHGSAREQCDYWERTLGAATRAGAVSLRVAGDMAACLDAGMSLEEVTEYESRYDRTVAARFPVATLCMYDVRRFESLEVVEALKSHKDMFRYPSERLFA